MVLSSSLTSYYLHVLSNLFSEIDETGLRRVLHAGEIFDIDPGEYLFTQGSKENSLFIVLTGRLRAVMQDLTGMRILGDVAEGEPTGEFALFTNEPRMASVLAIRKTTVLQISHEEYLNLVAFNPAFAGMLTSFLIRRLKRNMMQQHMAAKPKNIAVINLQPAHLLAPWTNEIKKTLEIHGVPIQVYDFENQPRSEFENDFGLIDQHEGMNILVCSWEHPEWSHQCLLYADLVIVATDFNADPGLYPIEEKLELYTQSILNKKIYIALLHEKTSELPLHTSRWLEKRPVNLHLHMRLGNHADIRRFCRIISNEGVGVVLGGGGTKGFAHVGAVEAMLEAGIEIDFIGGTSAGAIYGIGMSFNDFNLEKAHALCLAASKKKMVSNDLALPLVSLMSGKKVISFLKEMFGSRNLEDIWVNSFCVSTNFSTAGTVVHNSGLVTKMVQASIAIPGVFPPVVINNQLHVDGGVVDNLPIEPMYQYPARHIIAISLSSINSKDVDYDETPSAKTLLWNKITGKRRYRVPGIISLMINSLTLNSRQKQDLAKSKVSLYLELDLKGVGLMDDKQWKQTIQKGYDQMRAYLENLPQEERFWEGKTVKAANEEALKME